MLLTWVLSAAIVVVILFTPTYLQKQFSVPPALALQANSLAIIALTLGCVVFGIAADRVQEEMHGIWKREMSYGSYVPKWLNCVVGAEKVSALAFTVNRECSGYSGELPTDVMVSAIASARGRYGPAHDYLFKTTETLREHGIRDSRVEHLASLVRARLDP